MNKEITVVGRGSHGFSLIKSAVAVAASAHFMSTSNSSLLEIVTHSESLIETVHRKYQPVTE